MVVWTRMSRALKYSALILISATVGAYLSFLHFSQRKPEIAIQHMPPLVQTVLVPITTLTVEKAAETTDKMLDITPVMYTPEQVQTMLAAITPLTVEKAAEKDDKILDITPVTYEDDSQYFPDVIPHFSKDMLRDDFETCFFESFITEAGDTDSGLERDSFANHSNYKDFAGPGSEQMSGPLNVLTEFADLMSTLKIKAVLIEPSIIYCMLSTYYKRILLKRKFAPETYFKSKQVLTFGIREKYIHLLEKAETETRIQDANFTIETMQDPCPEWMQTTGNFKRGSITVHAVVFHKRGAYLWHGGMGSENPNVPKKKSLHFAEADSAFDSFIPVRPGFSHNSLTNVLIPSDPQYFLFQIPTSRFLECNAEVMENFTHASNYSEEEASPSPLSQHRFKMRTLSALRALKTKLNPLLMRFWIWSGTMLGWYRQCGIIPYTSDVDFAAWAEEVDDLSTVLELFQDDDYLKLKERMGVVQQGLEFNLNSYKLRVDIFFLYSESNGTWYAGHRPSKGYFFKYHHPNFILCSADLLGLKVLVPCEPEKNIRMEYGPNWMQPVSGWNYETSIFNRGPNIYWNESMRNQVFAEE